MAEKDAFCERVLQAAGEAGYAIAPRLVPSVTRAIDAADRRWFGLCAQLLSLSRKANSALGSADLAARIRAEAEAGRRELILRCGDKWLRLRRERLLAGGHITVERSYRQPGYPPEPSDPTALEELVFELIAAAGAATPGIPG